VRIEKNINLFVTFQQWMADPRRNARIRAGVLRAAGTAGAHVRLSEKPGRDLSRNETRLRPCAGLEDARARQRQEFNRPPIAHMSKGK
jgi:hypothetical protein